tara:strand:- start:425 stop:1060 length:636 start_codon:yes stop_codon:yes gene_type:complete
MSNLTISIIGNQTFLEIINELKLFSKYKVRFYDNLNLFLNNPVLNNQVVIFVNTDEAKSDYLRIKENHFPLIVINKSPTKQGSSDKLLEIINTPFKALDLEKKIISLLAKFKFKEDSLISLRDYIIDKNERKLKKKDLELQLTEKEINFLILFSNSNKPLSRNFILEKVWNYSSETDTHTVETHIHRLRKKILDKFSDSNFIKNDNKGYFI